MTNRLLAGGFVILCRHRAKPASEEIRRICERAMRGREWPKCLLAGEFVILCRHRAKPASEEKRKSISNYIDKGVRK